MPPEDAELQPGAGPLARRLRLAVRWAMLAVTVALALAAVPGASATPGARTDVGPPWWQDVHRSEWSAVVPSLSPYVTALAAVARRDLTALTLLGLPVLLLAVFWKRWFCRYACPTGLVLDTVAKGNRYGLKLTRFSHLAQWAVLTTAAGAVLGFPFFLWLDPLSLFHGLLGAVRWPLTTAMTLAAVPALLVVAIQVVWPGAWCYRLCPLGYVQELFNAKRWLRPRPCAGAAIAASGGVPPVPAGAPALWSRRGLLLGTVGGVAAGIAFLGRRAIGTKRTALRPPGAVAEPLFQSLCTRCGNCVRVCPAKIIQPDLGFSGAMGLVAPALRMGPGYCAEDCNECGKVCPSGAIMALPVAAKNRQIIGVARIARGLCWPWKGIRECDKCATICPWEAIDNFRENPPMPVLLAGKCSGCGKCVISCPAAAIAVEPVDRACADG